MGLMRLQLGQILSFFLFGPIDRDQSHLYKLTEEEEQSTKRARGARRCLIHKEGSKQAGGVEKEEKKERRK